MIVSKMKANCIWLTMTLKRRTNTNGFHGCEILVREKNEKVNHVTPSNI